MEIQKSNALIFVNNNENFAYELRGKLMTYKWEASYVNSYKDLINKIISYRSCIVFFNDDCIDDYLKFSTLLDSDLCDKSIIVFVGDQISKISPTLKYPNVFYCDSTQLNYSIQNIINQYNLVNNKKDIVVVSNKVSELINFAMAKLGFTQKWVGYKFIKDGLFYAIDNNFNIRSLSHDLYDYVAVQNNTSAANVERSMRNSVLKAYRITKFDFFNVADMVKNGAKISNRFFLACMLDWLKQELLKDKIKVE